MWRLWKMWGMGILRKKRTPEFSVECGDSGSGLIEEGVCGVILLITL